MVNDNINKLVADAQGRFSELDVALSVLRHEIGHNLGGGHGDVQPMGSGHIITRYEKEGLNCIGEGCKTRAMLEKTTLNKKFAQTLVDRIRKPNGRKYLDCPK